MHNHFPLTKLTVVSALGLAIIWVYGCDSNNNTSIEIHKISAADNVLPLHSALKATKDSSFNSLDELLAYYQPRYFKLYNKEVEISKVKKSGKTLPTEFAGDLSDSSYRLIAERNKAILHYLLTHDKNEENFRGFTYLRKSISVPVRLTDSVFKLFPETLQKSAGGKDFLTWLNPSLDFLNNENYNPEILNLSFMTPAEEKTKLKDITSRYILLEFWAYWCSPCRRDNRELGKLKNLLPTQDKLRIVAVSVDNNKDRWLKAVKEDNLPYLSITDLTKFEDSPIIKAFKVNSIPANVLLSKEGKIIAHNLKGKELINKINSLP